MQVSQIPLIIDGFEEHPLHESTRQQKLPNTCLNIHAIKKLKSSNARFATELISTFIMRRQELGLSQMALAEKIGVSDYLVSKWEVGMRRPSGFLFFCWAMALGMELKAVLIDGEEKS
tara:strand:+ start:314 stop:667 length:354 start_codon:yes stop_codon:yes gene_type:complete